MFRSTPHTHFHTIFHEISCKTKSEIRSTLCYLNHTEWWTISQEWISWKLQKHTEQKFQNHHTCISHQIKSSKAAETLNEHQTPWLQTQIIQFTTRNQDPKLRILTFEAKMNLLSPSLQLQTKPQSTTLSTWRRECKKNHSKRTSKLGESKKWISERKKWLQIWVSSSLSFPSLFSLSFFSLNE